MPHQKYTHRGISLFTLLEDLPVEFSGSMIVIQANLMLEI